MLAEVGPVRAAPAAQRDAPAAAEERFLFAQGKGRELRGPSP